MDLASYDGSTGRAFWKAGDSAPAGEDEGLTAELRSLSCPAPLSAPAGRREDLDVLLGTLDV